jgi:hypothetical protein
MMLDLFYNQFEKDVARLGLATDVALARLKVMMFPLAFDETSSV